MQITIVIYLTRPWAGFHRGPMIRALAHNLLGRGNVLCVEPTISPLGSLARGQWPVLTSAYRGGGLKQESDNLFVLTPHALFYSPLRRFLDISGPALRHLQRQMEKALERIGNGRRVAWVYRPEHRYLLGLAKEELAVYECYDEYAFDWDDITPDPSIRQEEDVLLDNVDVVFVTSLALYQARAPRHPNVSLMPNGAEYDFYSLAQTSSEAPEGFPNLTRPRLIHVGDITERIDFDIFDALLAPDGSFSGSIVLLGGVPGVAPLAVRSYLSYHLSRMLKNPRVSIVDNVTQEMLLALLRSTDIALLPYKTAYRFRFMNPSKLWNYMAAGKVVVAADWAPEVRELADVVYIAKSPQDFVRCVQQALTSDNRDRVQRGIEVAYHHRWAEITRKALETVYAALGSEQPALTSDGTQI